MLSSEIPVGQAQQGISKLWKWVHVHKVFPPWSQALPTPYCELSIYILFVTWKWQTQWHTSVPSSDFLILKKQSWLSYHFVANHENKCTVAMTLAESATFSYFLGFIYFASAGLPQACPNNTKPLPVIQGVKLILNSWTKFQDLTGT